MVVLKINLSAWEVERLSIFSLNELQHEMKEPSGSEENIAC